MTGITGELWQEIASRVFVRENGAVRITRPDLIGNPQKVPWIFDFRAILLEPKWLNAYAEIFWEKHAHLYPFQVGGLESAGIPLVAAIVMKGVERGTPVNGVYIRKSRKREGLMRAIEGTLTNDPIILVDDIINSGSTFWKQILVLEDAGGRVTHAFAVLAFREPQAYAQAAEKGVLVNWIFSLKDFGLPLEPPPKEKLTEFSVAWRRAAPTPPSFEHVVAKSTPVIDGETIYVGTDAGIFYALDQQSGDAVWSFETGKHPYGKGILSSPALHDGTVYFGAYDGDLYALDARTGSLKWRYAEADWIGSSPTVAPELNLLYVGLEFGLLKKRGGIAALDLQNGKATWVDRSPSFTHGSPLYISQEQMVVVGSNDGVVYAYEARSGKRLWTYRCGADIKGRPAYDPVRRIIVVASMDTRLHALSASGELLWAFQTGAGIYSNPLVSNSAVYVASLDKTLYAIDIEFGREIASFETGGRIFASPIIADGSLWIGSNDGKLYELDPQTLAQRGSFQASERIVNAIAYSKERQRFFVPTIANELYCLARKT